MGETGLEPVTPSLCVRFKEMLWVSNDVSDRVRKLHRRGIAGSQSVSARGQPRFCGDDRCRRRADKNSGNEQRWDPQRRDIHYRTSSSALKATEGPPTDVAGAIHPSIQESDHDSLSQRSRGRHCLRVESQRPCPRIEPVLQCGVLSPQRLCFDVVVRGGSTRR